VTDEEDEVSEDVDALPSNRAGASVDDEDDDDDEEDDEEDDDDDDEEEEEEEEGATEVPIRAAGCSDDFDPISWLRLR